MKQTILNSLASKIDSQEKELLCLLYTHEDLIHEWSPIWHNDHHEKSPLYPMWIIYYVRRELSEREWFLSLEHIINHCHDLLQSMQDPPEIVRRCLRFYRNEEIVFRWKTEGF